MNFLSKDRRTISDISIVKELKLSDFKLREQYIDVVRIFKDGSNIKPSSNKYIIEEIEEKSIQNGKTVWQGICRLEHSFRVTQGAELEIRDAVLYLNGTIEAKGGTIKIENSKINCKNIYK